jgi:hypothetical protein
VSWVVVVVPVPSILSGGIDSVQVFGPYETAESAEQARRRIHFNAVRELGCNGHRPTTFIAPQQSESAL